MHSRIEQVTAQHYNAEFFVNLLSNLGAVRIY